MNELHLFAGAGGGILGGHLLRHTCVCAVEWNPYARRVLLQRQRDNVLPRFPIWDDVQTFDGKPWQGRVDVVCGGFPCQDISAAGKGAGINGAKSGMWRHMARIVSEVRPRYVFVENSPVLTSRGLGVVLGDLAAMGYDAEWCVLGAADAGAPHLRERIWIMAKSRSAGIGSISGEAGDAHGRASGKHVPALRQAHGKNGSNRTDAASESADATDATGGRPQRQQNCDRLHGKKAEERAIKPIGMGSGVSAAMAYTNNARRKKQRRTVADETRHEAAERGVWWRFEPELGRVANGVAHRVHRLTAIGNGQVPAVAALAWRTLMARIESR